MAGTMENFPPLLNDAIIKAALGKKPHRIPIWIMRQAGRYLPEFQEVRKEHEFFEIVHDPVLACKVTLQPIQRYDLDAAIIFSDILVIPAALGMEVKMLPGTGPSFTSPLKSPADIEDLNWKLDVTEKMKGTLQAITLTRKKLEGKVPLLGFVGAPWTLMSYMIEGTGSRTLTKSKAWLYKYPEESKNLLDKLTGVVVLYLVEQVKAGAQMLQVFESHADLLSPDLFDRFCKGTLARILSETKRQLLACGISDIPMTIFAKGGHYALHEISKLGYDVVGVDWTVTPKVARSLTIPSTVLQGNLDPVALFGSKESIKLNVDDMIKGFGTNQYICNLGHGIYPETPTENVQTFIDAVRTFKIE
ncbi:uroporphyrinogen decarboxylase [Folsomia candida]|uniref:Uroporphyrinogen decarboxylase n=1 Tax=Folsomia candida TaxID=158441 RepID=A0A226F3F9_FOLCA|nr:uroporphyrinogen decarboxylase [Folsomia candida]OXA64309.1 Uroporphyrinogen decarboxylase [Folsomia candida]